MGTSPQMTKLLQVFDGMPTRRMQDILESGLLTSVRDGDLDKKFVVQGALAHYVDCTHPSFQGNANDAWTVRVEDQVSRRLTERMVFDQQKISTITLRCQPLEPERKVPLPDFLKELQGWKVLPANFLDFYLRNDYLIPEEWKRYGVAFWGTIYRTRNEPDQQSIHQYVRYLWHGPSLGSGDRMWQDGLLGFTGTSVDSAPDMSIRIAILKGR